MLKSVLQVQTVETQITLVPLLILSVLAFLVVVAVLWRRGKTIEALLVWVSLLLYFIALILLLK